MGASLAVWSGSVALAAPEAGGGRIVCGAPYSAHEALFVHEQRLLLGVGPDAPRATAHTPAVDVGDIAVIEATPEILTDPNPLDLDGLRITIAPGGDGFAIRTIRAPLPVSAGATGLQLALEDDDFAVVELPFDFPYFGEVYKRAFVHSDGNITFLYPEHSSTPRSYTRAAGGPPRIAPLFRDLDPSRGGRVSYESFPDRVVVTWNRVPVFVDTGVGAPQTVQASLYADGALQFAYGDLDADGAVVGILPGDASAEHVTVDWSVSGSRDVAGADILAEIFTSERSLDEFSVAHAFYRTHDDVYDGLVLFNDMEFDASLGALAHAYTVRNEVAGIGESTTDFGSFVGSPRRLSLFVNMGPASDYPVGAFAPLPGLPHASMLTILAHEIGHRFLAYVGFTDPESGRSSRATLGRQLAHWSFFFNSEASVLEGNAIHDNGPGARPRFETFAASQTYSALDQYLMGLRTPHEVPPTFLVENPVGGTRLGTAARAPAVGVAFNGERKEILVSHIIDENGERRPDSTVSQRRFRHAFILVTADAEEPDPVAMRKIEQVRNAWPRYLESHTEGRAQADASLVRMLHLSTWPAGGVVAGSEGTARVEIAEPRATDMTVALRQDRALAQIPPTVVIPAGATHADFPIKGSSQGVAAFTAETSEPGFDRPETRLVVRAGYAGLTLDALHPERLYGVASEPAPVPLLHRIRDENLVPYSGVELGFRGAGSAESEDRSTDYEGLLTTMWRLGDSEAEQSIEAFIAAAPGATAATSAAVSPTVPTFGPADVVNAASLEGPGMGGGFAPGSLVTICGTGLALEEAAAASEEFGSAALPDVLGAVRVHVQGIPAPLARVSPTAVTFQVPFETQGASMQVLVATRYGRSPPVDLPVGPVQPGLYPDRVGPPASPAPAEGEPGLARAGGVLELEGTGLGQVRPAGRTALPAYTMEQEVVAETRAWVDGAEVPVAFSGLSTREAGVYVVRLELPDDLPAGEHTARIAVGGQDSNEVTFQSE